MMVTHLLLAHFKPLSENFDGASLDYRQALLLCQRLQLEKQGTPSRDEADFYVSVSREIEQALRNVDKGPGIDAFEHAHGIYSMATKKFTIEGNTYDVHPFAEMSNYTSGQTVGSFHFALPIPKDRWLVSASKKGDYALVRQEAQITQEGPGVSWGKRQWIPGRFERDRAGKIRFFPQKPYIIGDQTRMMGAAVALLKRPASMRSP